MCKYRENGYITAEKAYMDTLERERLIRHMMSFDSAVDKWIVMWEHDYNNKVDTFKKRTVATTILLLMPHIVL